LISEYHTKYKPLIRNSRFAPFLIEHSANSPIVLLYCTQGIPSMRSFLQVLRSCFAVERGNAFDYPLGTNSE